MKNEMREKNLIEGKFRAMEEMVSVSSVTSVESKSDVHSKRSKRSGQFNGSSHSDLVSSWILEQRRQNYQTELPDVHRNLVSNTLGFDISVPINEKELKQLHRQVTTAQQDEQRLSPADFYDDRNLDPANQTFTIDGDNQNWRPISSIQPTYYQSQNKSVVQRRDGRTDEMQNSNGQTLSNQRWHNDPKSSQNNGNYNSQMLSNNPPGISWNLNNHRLGQQSTQINNRTSGQINASQLGGFPNSNGHKSNQYMHPMQSQSNGTSQLPGQERLTSKQIAARHSMPKDLPYFYGHPHEWAQFIKRYENTTSICGFDDSENLERLNKCLKG